MIKMKKARKIIAAALMLSIMISLSIMPLGADSQIEDELPPGTLAAIVDKDEVVYARLSVDGEVKSVHVVNHFTLDGGGSFTDFGNYSSAVNLTDLYPISIADGEVLLETDSEDFFYQGNLADCNLPWIYSIEYILDGTDILPDDLAGCSGELEIRIASTKNREIDDVFYDNYMQQITVTLNIYSCKNIAANGATAANLGKNRMLVFTVMPGSDAEIKINAEVTDFEMAGIEIAAMPFSMDFELPDIDGMLADFDKLSEGIAELDVGAGELKEGAGALNDGTEELKAGSRDIHDGLSELGDGVKKLEEGASELNDGARGLMNGSADFGGGLLQLDKNSAQLTEASGQIRDALAQIADSLQTAAISSKDSALADLAALPAGLGRLADGLNQILDGMDKLKDGYGKAYEALDEAISGISDYELDEVKVMSLFAKADGDERILLVHLIESYIAAMTVKGTYEYAKPAFEAVVTGLETLSDSVSVISEALSDIAGQIDGALDTGDTPEQLQQLIQLIDGISQIAEKYADFHSGLLAYAKGVSDLAEGYGSLDFGIETFGGGVSEMYEGIGELYSGVGDLIDGYGEFDAGISDLSDGTAKMHEGLIEFHSGTTQLADETADMPKLVQDEIDSMLSKYMGKDFEVVSFASGKNKNISFVQFVFMTTGIEKPKTETAPQTNTKQPDFWDRLIGLFGG